MNAKMQKMFARYKTHDGPRGNPAEWAQQARILVESSDLSKHLEILQLNDMPTSPAELSRARNSMVKLYHPDRNKGSQSSQDMTAAINEAYEKIQSFMVNPTASTSAPATVGAQNRVLHPAECNGELPSELNAVWVIADLKIDGERFVMYLNTNPYTEEPKTTLLSRYVSKLTKEYGNRSVSGLNIKYPGLDGTVLDGELYQGKYYAFDLLFDKGVDLRKEILLKRRERLLQVVAAMKNPLVEVVKSWNGCASQPNIGTQKGDIDAVFQMVTDAKGEGLVVKDLRSPYGTNWAKLKKSYDVSCVITGFREGTGALKGLVGSLVISVYQDGKLVEVGTIKPGTNQLHEDITRDRKKYWCQVVDVFAQEMTVHNKLRHATFHRFREDVNSDTCTMEKLKEDFKKAARANRNKS